MSRLPNAFLGAPLAHRGFHDRSKGVIENSMQAIRAAIAAGYGIEIDVQPSADATPMVFHDYMMERLAGVSGPIHGKSTDDLRAISLTGSSDTIPTLDDVLAEVDGRVPLLIEIKDQDMRLGPNVGPLQEKVCQALEGYDGPVAVMSFNPHAIREVKRLRPELAIGLVTDAFEAEHWPNVPDERRAELAQIPDAVPLGIDFISHNQRDLDSAAVAQLKTAGLPILCWTVRDATVEGHVRKIADNITFEGYVPARRS